MGVMGINRSYGNNILHCLELADAAKLVHQELTGTISR